MSVEKYQLLIIGGGVGGLVSASGAAQLGAKVALVEKKAQLGGDCLNYGCVPTKALVRAADVAHTCRHADTFGMQMKGFGVDFHKVMERRHLIQQRLGEHDDPERFRRMGVEMVFGEGKFIDPHHFKVGERILSAKNFILATGSRPAELPIPGLAGSGYLNSETILGLLDLPKRLLIIGAGPIGLEYAQLMQRLGSKVALVEKAPRILPKDDEELAARLERMMVAEGVEIHTSVEIEKVERIKGGMTIAGKGPKGPLLLEGDNLFVAIGRTPNVEGLGLAEIGVKTLPSGIVTNSQLRTSVKNIFAVGDCTGPFPFTHVAEYQAGIAISNALFPLHRHVDYRAVPWVTYTDPELAHVGMSEEQAKKAHGHIEVLRFSLADIDRAVIEGHTRGMAKVIADKNGKVLGASLLGKHAGDLLPQYCLAVKLGLKVQQIAQTVIPYPTSGQLCWRVAQQWYKKRLFEGTVGKLSRWWLKRS